MLLKLKTAYAILLMLAICTQAEAHHFPPGLEGTLIVLPANDYLVEVLLLPAVAEVGRITGLLISIRKVGNDQYYTGPISLELRPHSEPDITPSIRVETFPRPDLQGDREARHIFQEPGRYVATLDFQPEGKILAVTFPIEAVTSSGPSIFYLGLILAIFVGSILVVAYLQSHRNKGPENSPSSTCGLSS